MKKNKREIKLVSEEYAAWAREVEARINEITGRLRDFDLAVESARKGSVARFRKVGEITKRAPLQAGAAELEQFKAEIETVLAPMFKAANALLSIQDFLFEVSYKE